MGADGTATDNGSEEVPKVVLEAGQMKLFSYHIPALPAGDYTINVEHNVAVNGTDKALPVLKTDKKFRITAPRYALPPNTIHSCYPHHGHSEGAHVLPHILFNDPHLPWERAGGEMTAREATQMPWLAILAFEVGELQVSNAPPQLADLKVSASMSYRMPLSTLWKTKATTALPFPAADVANPDDANLDALRPDGEKMTTNIDVIFLNTALFKSLFSEQSESGDGKPFKLSLERYKYMAHVRIVHTHGMARAGGGVANDGANKEFSVVVSPRSGPTHLLSETAATSKSPVSMVAHLVSLDGIKNNINTLAPEVQNVGLISLYSWSYECLPPNSVDYGVMMERLTKTMQPFCMPNEVISAMTGERSADIMNHPAENGIVIANPNDHPRSGPEAKWLRQRLENGYTFIRYRPSSGENTLALYRGPLIPRANDRDTEKDLASSDGSDLQILDHSSGLPDISYHLAWELGRSLAASDRFFSGAMMRIRAEIQRVTQNLYQVEVEKEGGSTTKPYLEKDMLIKNIHESVMNDPTHDISMHKRWNKHVLLEPENDNLDDPDMTQHIKAATETVTHDGKAVSHAETAVPPSDEPRSEVIAIAATETDTAMPEATTTAIVPKPSPGPETAFSPATPEAKPKAQSDWAIIKQWCLDKLMLKNIPTVYVFPDPDALPDEALRTFYVDETWMNCFLDGALSVANHALYTELDTIRSCLKLKFNEFLRSPSHVKQIPCWGFFIRSQVIQVFPDLQVDAPWDVSAGTRAQMARMEHLAPDTLMCLFDRRPDEGQFPQGIEIAQPPHQQRFSVGSILTDTELEITYKALGHNAMGEQSNRKRSLTFFREKVNMDPTLKPIYDWDSRCLVFPEFAKSCAQWAGGLGTSLVNTTKEADSALVGIELNDLPLTIKLTQRGIEVTAELPPPRQLPEGIPSQEMPVSKSSRNKPTSNPSVTEGSAIFPPSSIHHVPNFAFPRPQAPIPRPVSTLRANAIFKPASTMSPTDTSAPASPLQSQLAKSIFPLLQRGRNIPVSTHSSLGTDLVFSLAASLQTPPSTTLTSLAILIPAGNNAQDLLRVTRLDAAVLTVLPHVRTVGKGNRWIAIGSEYADLPVMYKSAVRKQTGAQRPSSWFVVNLVSRGEGKGPALYTMPDLSFVLEGADVSTLPGKDVPVWFMERYGSIEADGKIVDLGMVVSKLGVEKEAVGGIE